MAKIIRTPTQAKGGITPEEAKALKAHADLWVKRIMRTEPIDPLKIIPAIERLYEVSGRSKPRVVVVPSPLVANLAGGLSAAIWHLRKRSKPDATRAATDDATYAATRAATRDATDDATYAATYAATDAATRAATRAATYAATRAATYAATDDATRDATYDATYAATDDATDAVAKPHWLRRLVNLFTPNSVEFSLGVIKATWNLRQGGNHWGQYDSYLSAYRDVLGLTGLDCWDKYSAWEECAIEGSWRIMHEEFCMVSDFPEVLQVDAQNRPHSEVGPSHRWRDGWELFHLDGQRLDRDMWTNITSKVMAFGEIMKIENADIRALALKYNPEAVINANSKLVDISKRGNALYLIQNTELNTFLEEPEIWFLKMQCPTGRSFIEGVEPSFAKANPKADLCQARALGLTANQYKNLAIEG